LLELFSKIDKPQTSSPQKKGEPVCSYRKSVSSVSTNLASFRAVLLSSNRLMGAMVPIYKMGAMDSPLLGPFVLLMLKTTGPHVFNHVSVYLPKPTFLLHRLPLKTMLTMHCASIGQVPETKKPG
jgi:hypothetical protein